MHECQIRNKIDRVNRYRSIRFTSHINASIRDLRDFIVIFRICNRIVLKRIIPRKNTLNRGNRKFIHIFSGNVLTVHNKILFRKIKERRQSSKVCIGNMRGIRNRRCRHFLIREDFFLSVIRYGNRRIRHFSRKSIGTVCKRSLRKKRRIYEKCRYKKGNDGAENFRSYSFHRVDDNDFSLTLSQCKKKCKYRESFFTPRNLSPHPNGFYQQYQDDPEE